MRFDGRGHLAHSLATGKLRQTCSTYKTENKDEKGCKHTQHTLRSKGRKVETYPTSHSTMDQAEPILGVSSGMWHSGCLSCQAPSNHVHQPGVKGLKRREEEEEDRTKVSRPLGGRMTEDRISQEVRSSTATGCHS